MSSKKLAACALHPRFALLFRRRENRHFTRFSIIFTVSVTAEKLLLSVSLREPEIIQVLREASVGKEVPCIFVTRFGGRRGNQGYWFQFLSSESFPLHILFELSHNHIEWTRALGEEALH